MHNKMILSLLMASGSLVHATSSVQTVIRQGSVYDYPKGFEEIYTRPIITQPPASIASFVDKDFAEVQ
jgi:hypothetical protein